MYIQSGTRVCLLVTWKINCKIVILALNFWAFHASSCLSKNCSTSFTNCTSFYNSHLLSSFFKDSHSTQWLASPFLLYNFLFPSVWSQTSLTLDFTQPPLIICDNVHPRRVLNLLQSLMRNKGASEPYGHRFKSRMMHFRSSALLMCLGRQWKLAQILGPPSITVPNHKQKAGSEEEQLGQELAPICDASVLGGGLIHYSTVPASPNSFS